MRRARLVPLPLRWHLSKFPITLLVTLVLFAGPRVGGAAAISSRVIPMWRIRPAMRVSVSLHSPAGIGPDSSSK